MRCEPFGFEDFARLDVLEHQQQDWQSAMPMMPPEMPDTVTVWHEQTRIACMGLLPYPEGYAAWILIDHAAHDHPVSLTRAVRRRIAQADAEGLRPIRAHAEGRAAARWLRLLGFHSDGETEFGYPRFTWGGPRA